MKTWISLALALLMFAMPALAEDQILFGPWLQYDDDHILTAEGSNASLWQLDDQGYLRKWTYLSDEQQLFPPVAMPAIGKVALIYPELIVMVDKEGNKTDEWPIADVGAWHSKALSPDGKTAAIVADQLVIINEQGAVAYPFDSGDEPHETLELMALNNGNVSFLGSDGFQMIDAETGAQTKIDMRNQ